MYLALLFGKCKIKQVQHVLVNDTSQTTIGPEGSEPHCIVIIVPVYPSKSLCLVDQELSELAAALNPKPVATRSIELKSAPTFTSNVCAVNDQSSSQFCVSTCNIHGYMNGVSCSRSPRKPAIYSITGCIVCLGMSSAADCFSYLNNAILKKNTN